MGLDTALGRHGRPSEEDQEKIEATLADVEGHLRSLAGQTNLSYKFLRHHFASLLSGKITHPNRNEFNLFQKVKSDERVKAGLPPLSMAEMGAEWKLFKTLPDYKERLDLLSRRIDITKGDAGRSQIFKRLSSTMAKNVSDLAFSNAKSGRAHPEPAEVCK